jgi:broad specificity phosphatase PhoE
MELPPSLEHLVLVRHTESRGDERRRKWQNGETYKKIYKSPGEEGLTRTGWDQTKPVGAWIQKHILDKYELERFDEYRSSPAKRSVQTAIGLALSSGWVYDANFDERKRGLISGLNPQRHKALFPESYAEQQRDPIHWVPPGGQSILELIQQVEEAVVTIQALRSIIVVTHRDRMWASMVPLEGLRVDELVGVNTDDIANGYVIHNTSIDPETGRQDASRRWVRKISPVDTPDSAGTFHLLR